MKLLGILFVILLLVLGVGLLAGWFDLTGETEAGRTRFGLEVDRDEVERDVDATRRAAENLGESVGDALDPDETLEGELGTIDLARERVELRTPAGETLELQLAEDAEVELDGAPAPLSALRAGDRLAVELEEVDGLPRAVRVVALREEG